MKTKVFWTGIVFFSLLAIFSGMTVYFLLPAQRQLENVPQILSSVGTLLTVIWFTASLFYQNRQIAEQSRQFQMSMIQARSDSRRSAIESARDYLRETERVFQERSGKRFTEALELLNEYMTIFRVLDSADPEVYTAALPVITRTEGALQLMVAGFETAARIYFESANVPAAVLDSPEGFLITYRNQIHKIPYFDQYDAALYFISETIDRLRPGRDKLALGSMVALALKNVEFFRAEKIQESIEKCREKHNGIPIIAEEYLKRIGKSRPTSRST